MKMFNKVVPRTSIAKWVLLVSLIVNLFLVGALAGGVLKMQPHKSLAIMLLATPHSKQMIKRIENNLNTVDAAAFREIIEQHNTALRQAHDAVYEAIKSVAATYEQDPVDPTTLQVSINHLNESRAILNDVVGKILADSSTKVSPEGRHLIAELK